MTNLAEIVIRNVDRIPESAAVVRPNGPDTTYAELGRTIARVCSGLRDRGIRAGDRVAYQVANGPVATTLYFAALSAGAVAVPMNPLLSSREVSDILARTDPALFASTSSESDPDVLLAGPEDIECLPLGDESLGIQPRTGNDAAVVFFTSGTTGTPKGVVLTHDNLRTNADWVCNSSLDGPAWGPGHVCAVILPLSHSFGMTCAQNAALFGGAALTYIARFNAPDVLRQICVTRVTTAAMVPSAARALMDAWQEAPCDIPLSYCLIGGAPIPSGLIAEIESTWGAEVLEGYGLTETSPVCAFRTPNVPRKAGSVGRAAGQARLAIASNSEGSMDEGEGELLVSGPGVSPGYYSTDWQPDVSRTRWFKTGDIARIDEEGDVFILDRKKDIIIHNGYNVYPTEVEAVIKASDAVVDAAVIGRPDPASGEAVVAFVVTADPETSLVELTEHCRTRLAKYKLPKEIRHVDQIPRGAKGQVLRDELRSAILT